MIKTMPTRKLVNFANLISIQEFCQITGATRATLHYYIKKGLIQPVYSATGHGGLYLFEKDKIMRQWKFIQKQKNKRLYRIERVKEQIVKCK